MSVRAIALALLVSLVLGFYGGYYVRDKAAVKKEVSDLKSYNSALRIASEQLDKANAKIDKITSDYLQAVSVKNETISNLERAVNTGAKQLRVQATCPSGPSNLPSTTARDPATGARLSRDAEQNYYRLRQQIADVEARLTSCRSYALQVTAF